MDVSEYSEKWPFLYEEAAAQLRELLGTELVRSHHIGSTSVPGLAAKPIIDILLEVRSIDGLDAYDASMRDLGYEPKGEFGIPGRRYFPKGGDRRTHHVHAFALGDPHVKKHLAFRDYLRAHPQAVAEYASIKKAASAAHATDPEGYMAFKHVFVEQMVTDAVHWMDELQPDRDQEESS